MNDVRILSRNNLLASSHFIIGMGVYYYPYQRDGVTQGEINTSATLNILYP